MSKLMRYRSEMGVVLVFAKPGRKKIALVAMDAGGLKVRRVPANEERYLSEIEYPAKKAVRKFLAAGRRFGISKGARELIKEAAA